MRFHGGRVVLDGRHATRIYRDMHDPLVYDGVLEVQCNLVYREG